MSLLSLIAALFIEQFRPLDYSRWVVAPVRALADLCERTVNAGTEGHGVLGWCLAVLLPAVLALVVFFVLAQFSAALALGWNVLVLYLTMGFRQFSHHFTEIHLALRMGELDRARDVLADWTGSPRELWSSEEIARQAIERALVASHRHVFGVLFWFVALPGPAGAVVYRFSAIVADRWAAMNSEREPFGRFALRAFHVIDWLPQRVTATGFAIVGNFEDAVQCWRARVGAWATHSAGVVLAAGAGALGVRLAADPGMDPGAACGSADADVDFMQSAVGLVWRALVLWLILLFMLGLASLVG